VIKEGNMKKTTKFLSVAVVILLFGTVFTLRAHAQEDITTVEELAEEIIKETQEGAVVAEPIPEEEIEPREIEEISQGQEEVTAEEGISLEPVVKEISEEVKADEEITASQLEVAEPMMLPDSRFYFLKNWGRGLSLVFTFDKVKKAEKQLQFADEKLIEAKKLIEKKGEDEKTQKIIEKTLDKYEKDITKLEGRITRFKEKAKENPKIDALLDKFTDHEIKHQKLLHHLEKKVEEKVENKIEREIRKKVKKEFKDKILITKDKIKEKIKKELEEGDITKEELEKKINEKLEGKVLKEELEKKIEGEVKEKVKEELPYKVFEKFKEVREGSLEKFGKVLNQLEEKEKIHERIGKIIEEQKGSEFKHFKNLEILKELEERVPEEAKEAIKLAQENALKRLEVEIKEIPEETRLEKFDRYVYNIAGNASRHIEILEDFKGIEPSKEMVEMIEKVEEKPLIKLEEKLEKLPTQEERERFLEHLKEGEMGKMKIIKKIENNLPPELKEEIKAVKERAFKKFEEKIGKLVEDPEKRREFFENMPPPPVEQFEVMAELEEMVPEDKKEFIQEMQEKSFEIMKEKIESLKDDPKRQELFLKVMTGPDPRFIEGGMDRLRALREIENNIDFEGLKMTDEMEKIKGKAIQKFEEKFTEEFKEIKKPEEREEFLKKIIRPDVKQFEIIEDLEKVLPKEKREFIDEMRKETFTSIQKGIENFAGDPEKQKMFIKRVAGEDPMHIEVLKAVEAKLAKTLPPQAKASEVIKRVIEKQVENVAQRVERIEDPEMLFRFREQVESAPQIRQEIMKKSPDFVKELKERERERIKAEIEGMDSKEEMEHFKKKLEEDRELKREFLKRVPDFERTIEVREEKIRMVPRPKVVPMPSTVPTTPTISTIPSTEERPVECKKECRLIGSMSEGWYDSCTGKLIEYAKCGKETPKPPKPPEEIAKPKLEPVPKVEKPPIEKLELKERPNVEVEKIELKKEPEAKETIFRRISDIFTKEKLEPSPVPVTEPAKPLPIKPKMPKVVPPPPITPKPMP